MQLLALAHGVRAAAGDEAAELLEGAQRGHAAGAVGDHAVLALEAAQRLLRAHAEHPVDPAGVEAELEQPLLQRGDVVADVGVAGQGQQPVAEPPAGGGQRPVGLGADDAVDGDAAALLELAQRPVGRLAEAVLGLGEQPELDERGLHLVDGGSGVATPVQLHGHLGLSGGGSSARASGPRRHVQRPAAYANRTRAGRAPGGRPSGRAWRTYR